MANKIKLGSRPKAFKPFSVKLTLPDGTEGQIEAAFKYFTKTESGALVDELAAKARAKGSEASADTEGGLKAILELTKEHNADLLMRVIDSWDLDEDLTKENLQQLDDEIPAATTALLEAFFAAARQGRLGN
ncbi:phage tail assembly chaperone [Neopusillimonas aromaticivorans]|uniref:phage tail assembly chaperone n=1 Tax=Neopusillimonas aromaticivorans TaxID=2979868 RepID=UPI00259993F8|nr:phage tail assembly chaperone [Neopusillimonas aromaticivorans]WJJ93995.1 phage tail assembly chaperone [Neopusillimonas aromaticivorans]